MSETSGMNIAGYATGSATHKFSGANKFSIGSEGTDGLTKVIPLTLPATVDTASNAVLSFVIWEVDVGTSLMFAY